MHLDPSLVFISNTRELPDPSMRGKPAYSLFTLTKYNNAEQNTKKQHQYPPVKRDMLNKLQNNILYYVHAA